jgi:two-component system, OmpR family, alkaline phosphatase synthesis response regulator PhoP
MEKRIVLVDDELDIVELLEYQLLKQGYKVFTETNPQNVLALIEEQRPNLVLLDLMMPGTSGLEIYENIKSKKHLSETAVMFLTASADETKEILAFEMGAQDYIHKPINIKILMSRIDAVFKRQFKESKSIGILEIQQYKINPQSYSITDQSGNKYSLPKKEFKILYFLAHNNNKIFSREQILANIWDEKNTVFDRTIDVHIRKIRAKLGDTIIKTVKGVGYVVN